MGCDCGLVDIDSGAACRYVGANYLWSMGRLVTVLLARSSPPLWIVALVILGYLSYQQYQLWRAQGNGAWLASKPVTWLGWLLVATVVCLMSGLFLIWWK